MKMRGYDYSLFYYHKKKIGIPRTPIKFEGYATLISTVLVFAIVNILGFIFISEHFLLVLAFSLVGSVAFVSAMTNIDKETGQPYFMKKYFERKKYYLIVIVDGLKYRIPRKKKKNIDDCVLLWF